MDKKDKNITLVSQLIIAPFLVYLTWDWYGWKLLVVLLLFSWYQSTIYKVKD